MKKRSDLILIQFRFQALQVVKQPINQHHRQILWLLIRLLALKTVKFT